MRDSVGTIVYTETQVCQPTSYTLNGPVMKTFTVQVPTPGNYSYNILTTSIYTLINGQTITNSYNSESYSFSISAAIFYDALLCFSLLMIATFVLMPITNGQAIPANNIYFKCYLIHVLHFTFFKLIQL